jgi:hypothetical protein
LFLYSCYGKLEFLQFCLLDYGFRMQQMDYDASNNKTNFAFNMCKRADTLWAIY